MIPGPRNLITDVPGLKVGNARHATYRTGTTVLTADAPFLASCAVMGGAPGTRETDLLAPDKSATQIDAIALSGGSAFGLDAASGVMAGLRAQGRGVPVHLARVPIVPAAIIFDLYEGIEGHWPENPYPALGRAALEAASPDFEIGTQGAGTGALGAMMKGGLGSASLVLPSGATVGALVVANPVGHTNTPGDRHFWAASQEIGDEFGGFGPDPRAGLGLSLDSRKAQVVHGTERANTAIAIVATDADLSKSRLHRMATAAHDGLARAIVPAHTPFDGDIVFAASTGARPLDLPDVDLMLIGHAAAHCLARAVARGVYHATPEPGDLLPCWKELNA
ncbi:P1 family peptidase [Mesobacterium pallidum]|uniref:P1 family peptidase n=1 Tax=Mesobacterium pallidum TaxID=2872037 RepID=UPI001EE2A0B6|nr:P1 family peptidase [Mesobacterium pallidum]